MDNLLVALLAGILILIASMLSVELGLSVALIEITMGIIGANVLGLQTTGWIDFLASFASIVLTFLAGAEVDVDLMRAKAKESLLIGGLSFLLPFLGAMAFAYWGLGWSVQASQITGVALSTTSLAVVYSVLAETGLIDTQLGKTIMAATFVTDFATAIALSLLFITPNANFVWFILVSIAVIVLVPRLAPWFFKRYGHRVIEPEIKLIFVAIFALMYFAEIGAGHAVLPAFIFGLAMSKPLALEHVQQQRLRVVAFALLTPFFFIKSGLNISIPAVLQNWSWLILLLAIKLALKFVGVFPVAVRYVRQDARYTTLLMSTGLTFGTIASLYGLNAGILDKAQFSVLVTVVVVSAVAPTLIAQRFFSPQITPEPAPTAAAVGEPAPAPKSATAEAID